MSRALFAFVVMSVTLLGPPATALAAPKTYRQVAAEQLQDFGVLLMHWRNARPFDAEKPVDRIFWLDPEGLNRPAAENAKILSLISLFTEIRWLNIAHVPLRDGDLTFLRRLTNLKRLRLCGTQATGAGLIHANSLTELEVAELSESPINDAGLTHLTRLFKLRRIELRHTKVTDAGLRHLAKIESLRAIDLRFTAVTDQGVDELSLQLGDAAIDSGSCRTLNRPYRATWGASNRGLQLGIDNRIQGNVIRFYVRNATGRTIEVCMYSIPPAGVRALLVDERGVVTKNLLLTCALITSGTGPMASDVKRLKPHGTIAGGSPDCTFDLHLRELDALPTALLNKERLLVSFELTLDQHQGEPIVLSTPPVSVDMVAARIIISDQPVSYFSSTGQKVPRRKLVNGKFLPWPDEKN